MLVVVELRGQRGDFVDDGRALNHDKFLGSTCYTVTGGEREEGREREERGEKGRRGREGGRETIQHGKPRKWLLREGECSHIRGHHFLFGYSIACGFSVTYDFFCLTTNVIAALSKAQDEAAILTSTSLHRAQVQCATHCMHHS